MSRRVLCSAVLAFASLIPMMPRASAAVPWAWPVVGPIIRGFDPPTDPYGSGHRGIDIATDLSTVIVAPEDGVVTFAGKVGGRLFLTIDHGGGLSSTCSWLNGVTVRTGDHVARGQPVALTGWGHPDEQVPHLHFGVRLDGTYVDPLLYLGWPSVAELIRLAPLEASTTAPRVATGRMTSLAYPTMAGAAGVGGPGVGGVPRQRGAALGRASVASVPGQRAPIGVRFGGSSRASLHRLVACRDGYR
jgi:hypothetical protein